ncbi:hypothetical protein LCGC14_0243740 [marine sediment metagenome]|uniref:Uncharacterized protein n=1 Tax=marine sediment metagenome TaxID=412755 RepID=A0A0F9UMS0_9ZZZZ
MSFRLVQTCGACPEQYDVLDENDEQVGYLRLRHGGFRADYPGCGGETVYSATTVGDGMFEDSEREYHLSLALEAIRLAHEGIEAEEVERLLELSGNDYASAMLRYGRHEDACNIFPAGGIGLRECDCGFALFTGELQASDKVRAIYEKRRKA